MGLCKYCGLSAGFLRRSHAECKNKHTSGLDEIICLVSDMSLLDRSLSKLEGEINRIAKASFIGDELKEEMIVSGWNKAVNLALADDLLSEDEEGYLFRLMDHFSISQDDLNKHRAFTKLIQGACLRDVLNGVMPNRMEIQGNLPFNLLNDEKVVWVFKDVDYYENRTRTKYVGGSSGVSIKIAKGVYYRTSGFKGERVQSVETMHVDTGLLAITNKHIYFSGDYKKFRISYKKIVSFDPFTDGIGLQKDAATAKPQIFVTNDGWFTYNLVTNLAQMN